MSSKFTCIAQLVPGTSGSWISFLIRGLLVVLSEVWRILRSGYLSIWMSVPVLPGKFKPIQQEPCCRGPRSLHKKGTASAASEKVNDSNLTWLQNLSCTQSLEISSKLLKYITLWKCDKWHLVQEGGRMIKFKKHRLITC